MLLQLNIGFAMDENDAVVSVTGNLFFETIGNFQVPRL